VSFTSVVKEEACVRREKNKDVFFKKYLFVCLSCLMYRACVYATKFLLDKGAISNMFCKLKGLLDRRKNSSNDGLQMMNMELQNMPLTHQLMPLIITRLLGHFQKKQLQKLTLQVIWLTIMKVVDMHKMQLFIPKSMLSQRNIMLYLP